MSSLIFIDTNIFLDFYRNEVKEANLSILQHIKPDLRCFISTAQVEMEFKKNRQATILNSYKMFARIVENINPPVLLLQTKQNKALKANQKRSKILLKTLKIKMEKVLTNPVHYDPVYKAAQRIFRSSENLNLSKYNKLRFQIRLLAKKRYCLGYPPKKHDDTSIGDAINWEWIIYCAKKEARDVVIVSRDSDYGVLFNDKPILNDWLQQEFKERVGRKKIVLTTRLTEGLKLAGIAVTAEEEETERELDASRKKKYPIEASPLNPSFVNLQGLTENASNYWHSLANNPNDVLNTAIEEIIK